MASPMPTASSGNWAHQGQQMQQHRPEPQAMAPVECGHDQQPQSRLMGLKVSYTVDREAQVNYLARHPNPLLVQVIPLDATNSVGVVDLVACAEAVANSSPELMGQDLDYAVYAYDFSEPDQPLVGQGMLSWILQGDFSQQKFVLGRVTRNVLAAFAGGLRETLEVKFKLSPSPRIVRPQPKPDFERPNSHMSFDMSQAQSHPRQQSQESAMTPTGVAEWKSFVHTNLQSGQPANSSRVASPAPSQTHVHHHHHHRHDSFSHQGSPAPTQQMPPSLPRQSSYQDQDQDQQSRPRQPHPGSAPVHFTGQQTENPNRVTPTLVETNEEAANDDISRPSSRASTRSRKKKQPTGRPRGRPRKKAAETQGSTSGYEDGTDGEEGPAKKKRATTVQVNKNINAPFGGSGGPESLRVAASTSGSLRTLRPPSSAPEAIQGNHLQEVPRAPTPVPGGGPRSGPAGRITNMSGLRRQSTLSQASAQADQPPYCEASFEMSPPSQDGRSPLESEAATPMYSEDSPAAIGSSPPVPRTTSFMRSSPPASSPILPPMPKPQPDSGFMSGGVSEMTEEVVKPLELPPPSSATMVKPKRARNTPRNTPKFPVRVFDMQLAPISSEADLVPFHHVQAPQRFNTPSESLPPLQRSRSNTRNTMPPPPSEAGKEPSPQSEEPAVANNLTIVEFIPTGSTEQAPQQPTEAGGPDADLDLISQLQAATRESPNAVEAFMQAEAVMQVSNEADEADEVALVEFEPSPAPAPEVVSTGKQPQTRPPVPASDPVGALALPPLPMPDATSFSEAPCAPGELPDAPDAPTDAPSPPRSSKNFVKKDAIRAKLQQAIESGEMPPYCHNCGAIETPTWRKIWVQEHDGVPQQYDYSEKPGMVTAVIVLTRDHDNMITKYQLIKKGLAPWEEKTEWLQLLLCNPCGIWLCKWKNHRPRTRWEKDQNRLVNGGRKGRRAGPRSRSKKSKTELTSEINLPTDQFGLESSFDSDLPTGQLSFESVKTESRSREASLALEQALLGEFVPGSSHSRGSGTVQSPITLPVDEEAAQMGATRRLLFPSPRKDGSPKLLHDVSINLVQTPARPAMRKDGEPNKENALGTQPGLGDDDELEALFRSPIVRPSTPPPNAQSTSQGPFKTPTGPTPSHRPITRSISRSIRSTRSVRSSEQLAMLQQTPTRTPRSVARVLVNESPTLRRSPRFRQSSIFETPMTRSLNQLLSDAHDYDMDSANLELDMSALPRLDNDHAMFDFGSLLSTDAIMPSSPPKGGRVFGMEAGAASIWDHWGETANLDLDMAD